MLLRQHMRLLSGGISFSWSLFCYLKGWGFFYGDKMSFSFNPFDREYFEHWKLCMNNKLLKSLRNFIFYCQILCTLYSVFWIAWMRLFEMLISLAKLWTRNTFVELLLSVNSKSLRLYSISVSLWEAGIAV